MLKNNIIHSRMLLKELNPSTTGVFVVKKGIPRKINFDNIGDVEINFSQSFGTCDKTVSGNYFVINKHLYYFDSNYNANKCVYRSVPSGQIRPGVGDHIYLPEISSVRENQLVGGLTIVTGYSLYDDGDYLDSKSWFSLGGAPGTHAEPYWNSGLISHTSPPDGYNVYYSYGYGIANSMPGNLYKIWYKAEYTTIGGRRYYVYTPQITKIGSSSNWEFVQGTSDANDWTYGINGGKLYKIKNETVTSIGSNTDWDIVCGRGSSCYGLSTDGHLRYVNNTTVTQVGTSEKWTTISKNYGICDGKLYYLDGATATQVGNSTKWTEISGRYGICDRILYYLSGSKAMPTYLDNCVGIYGSGDVIAYNNVS